MNIFFINALLILIIIVFLSSTYQYVINKEQFDTSLNEITLHPNILKLDMTRSERGIPITEAIIDI